MPQYSYVAAIGVVIAVILIFVVSFNGGDPLCDRAVSPASAGLHRG